MVIASDIRVGNVIRVDGKLCKVLTQEIRGTGKFGKSAMLKLRSLEEGHVIEKKMSADADAEEVDVVLQEAGDGDTGGGGRPLAVGRPAVRTRLARVAART